MDENRFSNSLSRRAFFRQAACAAVGTAALSANIRNLRLMNAAVAQSGINDYKALVCIFLSGGNDSNNLIAPTIASEYANYATIRGANLALPLNDPNASYNIRPISPLNSDGHEYGFHPSCPELVTLFGEGKLAALFNAGTLVYPLTRAQYQSSLYKKPPQLFSHSDQISQWQTSIPNQPPVTGWGGRVADLLNSVQPTAPISMVVSLNGANTFEVGNVVSTYNVSTSGAINLSLPSSPSNRQQAITNILNVPYTNLQTKAYADIAQHALNTGAVLNAAITPTAAASYWSPQFPGAVVQPTNNNVVIISNSSLGQQLRMIARLIEAGHRSVAAGGFGMKRQIFFCSIGGYDLHSGQTAGTTPSGIVTGQHANLLAEVSQCMLAFQRAMEKIGTVHSDPNFSSRVTAFTSSDFGRTFPTNGVGSDHGWGSHHLIMGGAVQGQRTYGKFPTLAINGPDDTSTGRWIPTTATDQYFATLATWFGVDNSNLATVFPNLGNFATPNLGFI